MKMDLLDWFDINNEGHVEAYRHLMEHGVWPQNFTIPEDVSFTPAWQIGIANMFAKAYLEKNKTVGIEEWIYEGNEELSASGITDTDGLLQAAANALDNACSWDIVGPILFKGTDGEYYVGTVEFVISKANADYVADSIKDM